MKTPFIILSILCLASASSISHAQRGDYLTLEECYELAMRNYPLVKQRGLIQKASALTIENIQKGLLPQLSVLGQASYQSSVTELPFKLPGVVPPTISKDQYRLYGDLSLLVFDGGQTRQQEQLQQTSESIQQQQLEAELYKLKERVNQLFFGTLLIAEQLKQSHLLINDIQTGINKVQAAISYGTALKSNADVLRAELLRSQQRTIELQANQTAYINTLSLFIGQTIGSPSLLVRPAAIITGNVINRPELIVYKEQSRLLDAQDKMLAVKTRPRVNVFVQAGAGRPGLNMLSNKFEPYYIGGIRLNWSLVGIYTLKRDRSLIEISRQHIEVQKETFLLNTNMMVSQQTLEISKYIQLLASDDEIIALRTKFKNTAFAQLENGVINSNDYLREVNAEDQARQSKIVHETQLLMAEYNQQTTTGNKQ
ncbi:transporter [Segetibacter sp. 3557_3]|uniref:TolC family protein n=1 Tax=Segetibacter sp. 3557_3 TaxID=2547429 RepID=UPI0010590259|nr:TolC family protein [Segetibacter sp. 3557_3]TDH28686.1 transporter [Segetibacter sp. 3557_3]